MENNDIVKWNPTYSVGIKLIDEQHQELVKATNALFVSCLNGEGMAKAVLLKTIHEAVAYAQHHFATEEVILQRIKYPDFNAHKREHEEFVKHVLLTVQELETAELFVPNKFARFLRDWVLTHIAVSDRKYGDYLRMRKPN